MIRVYICQKCGWIRTVSRRKDVECFKCGVQKMTLTKMEYEKYIELDQKERTDYADGWLYINSRAAWDKKQNELKNKRYRGY